MECSDGVESVNHDFIDTSKMLLEKLTRLTVVTLTHLPFVVQNLQSNSQHFLLFFLFCVCVNFIKIFY